MTNTLTIGLLLPDVLGTYGDDGNALVLRQRARMRGIDAHIRPIPLTEDIPSDCDIYTLGGGEDSAQIIAASRLQASPGLQRAIDAGRPVFAVCAGMQVLGHSFTAHGEEVAGIGVLDVRTSPMSERAIGEVQSHPLLDGLSAPLTGFENHMGGTTLGPDASPLGQVKRGMGNNVGAGSRAGVEGVVQGSVIATYMHGPALARNPELADLLLARALGIHAQELTPLALPEVDQLRKERLK